jgi:16S rRNA (uracil1498-N3)-methyltransferase
VGATRFFVSGTRAVGEAVALEPGDARKLALVLRRRDGDALEIVDGTGRAFAARLRLEPAPAHAVLDAQLAGAPPPSLHVVLAQGLPKAQKMETIVEKATELGVAAVLPFASERTVGDTARDGKLERWRRVAKSAAQQSGRGDVPDVFAPVRFADVVAATARYDLTIVPWEGAPRVALRESLPVLLREVTRALVVIGPEGGFSPAEARAFAGAGAHLVSLGARILRTETAGLVACAALLYASGDL